MLFGPPQSRVALILSDEPFRRAFCLPQGRTPKYGALPVETKSRGGLFQDAAVLTKRSRLLTEVWAVDSSWGRLRYFPDQILCGHCIPSHLAFGRRVRSGALPPASCHISRRTLAYIASQELSGALGSNVVSTPMGWASSWEPSPIAPAVKHIARGSALGADERWLMSLKERGKRFDVPLSP
jgi:hypothetical protein